MLAALAASMLAAAPVARASQAASCPPQTADMKLLHVQVGQPLDDVVARVGCLPLGETLSSITIDWGDGQTSAGTATYQTEAGGTSETALVHGVHTYATATCVAGDASCPNAFPVHASVVTASDDAALPGGGYSVVVLSPAAVPGPSIVPGPGRLATIKLEAKPLTRRVGRRVFVSAGARVACPKQADSRTPCTARFVIRKRPHGKVIARTTLSVAPGTSLVPTAYLNNAASRTLISGLKLAATITVSIDQHRAGISPISAQRTTLLHVRSKPRAH